MQQSSVDITIKDNKRLRQSFLLCAALAVLCAVALRAYHLGERSLWLDEAIAANISRGTLTQTLLLTRGFHSAPILDPLVLFGVERISGTPLAVRLPSFVASIAAVLLMLAFAGLPSIEMGTAGISALMLAVSASQIRYAQEVREYSLGVLYATLLLFVFLSYLAQSDESKNPIWLATCLFFAPFVQYGLVLFAISILLALSVLTAASTNQVRRILHVATAGSFLLVGGLLSFLLTLRYQWGDDAWYLKNYLWQPGTSLFHFLAFNTHHLFTFLLPGLLAAAISVLAILISIGYWIYKRELDPVFVLACTSCGIVVVCALLRVYPYGGIRQCLFLAPILILLAAQSLSTMIGKAHGLTRNITLAIVVLVIGVSGVLQIRSLKPYAEVEDMQRVLGALRSQIRPEDKVYVYPGAVFAVDFYIKDRDPRFIYGDYHQQAPSLLAADAIKGINANTTRLWLVFSHIYKDEDVHVIHDLSDSWNVSTVTIVQGAMLCLAVRNAKSDVDSPPHQAHVESYNIIQTSKRKNDFWAWNLRNARKSIKQ